MFIAPLSAWLASSVCPVSVMVLEFRPCVPGVAGRVARSVHHDLVCVMCQPVECALGEHGVSKNGTYSSTARFEVMMGEALRFRSMTTS